MEEWMNDCVEKKCEHTKKGKVADNITFQILSDLRLLNFYWSNYYFSKYQHDFVMMFFHINPHCLFS